MELKVALIAVVPLVAIGAAEGAEGEVLTLEQVEQRAVARSFEKRAASLEAQVRMWEKRNAVAGLLPEVSYNLNYLRTDDHIVDAANRTMEEVGEIGNLFAVMFRNEARIAALEESEYGEPLFPSAQLPEAGGFEIPGTMYAHTLTHEVTVSQPISNGGSEIVGLRIAGHAEKAVEQQVRSVEQEAVYRARKAYFEAVSAEERLAVGREDLLWAEKNLARARTRHQGGAIPITDVLRWEAETARKESDLLQARALRTLSRYSLYQAMGLPAVQTDTTIDLQPIEVFIRRYEQSRELDAGSSRDNPRLKSLEELNRIEREMRRMAVTKFLPRLNAFYTYSWPWFLSDEDKIKRWDDRTGWTAGVSLSVPLFSGFRNTTSLKKATEKYAKSTIELRRTRQALSIEQTRTRLFYEAAWESVEAAKKQKELMAKNLKIMQQRYDGGLVNQTQLLELSVQSRLVRTGYIQKLFECLLLRAEYEKTIGTLEVAQ